MAITRWRPFRDLVTVQDEMNSFLENFLGRPLARTEWIEDAWSPSVDISETKDNLVIKAEIPGMKKEDIEISIHDSILTLRGEKKQEKEEKDVNYHRIERSYGSFYRSFTLPASVKADKVKATYKEGVLNITLPKTEEAKPKEIPINVE
jgi:HSP20 family protein